MLLYDLLHLLNFLLEILDLANALDVVLLHLFLGLLSDFLGFFQGVLGHGVVFGQVLIHVLEFVQVSQLFELIINNSLLLLLDSFDNVVLFIG